MQFNEFNKYSLEKSTCFLTLFLFHVSKKDQETERNIFQHNYPQTEGECASQALFSSSCPTKTITGIDV